MYFRLQIALALQACAIVVFEKFTSVYLHQIAFKIMILPIQRVNPLRPKNDE